MAEERLIGPLLRSVRLSANMTQRELADVLERSQPYVLGCESGRRKVSLPEVVAFALGCRTDPHMVLHRYLLLKNDIAVCDVVMNGNGKSAKDGKAAGKKNGRNNGK